jgi:hypothetical protein
LIPAYLILPKKNSRHNVPLLYFATFLQKKLIFTIKMVFFASKSSNKLPFRSEGQNLGFAISLLYIFVIFSTKNISRHVGTLLGISVFVLK